MTEKSSYPNVASIIALIGGILILLGGMLLTAVSAFVLPYLTYTDVNPPPDLLPSGIPHLVSGMVGVMGVFGLISGVMVLASAVMVRLRPDHRETWGILMLVFSLLSFISLGGFILGALLGIVGGIMTLRWRPPKLLGSNESETRQPDLIK
jgi:MFS family permease